MIHPLRTYEILIGKDLTTLRATADDAKRFVCGPGRRVVKRGYTTWRIYEGKRDVGSMQELS